MISDYEIESNGGVCKNCANMNNCNRYCLIHAGKALYNFLSNIDTTETRIGEYESRTPGGVNDLVISGHQLYDVNNQSWILTDIKTSLKASSKFEEVFDKNASQILTLFCRKADLSKEEFNNILEKARKIDRNKLLILPIKPNLECSVMVEESPNRFIKRECRINYLKWTTNEENYELECTVCFEFQHSENRKPYKLPITDYMNKFEITSMDIQVKSRGNDLSLIEMTNDGIIKPIVIIDGNKEIAIDGTFIYGRINGEVRIIGEWDKNDKMVLNTDKKILSSTALNKLTSNEAYIRLHKRYMAPYMLYKPNIIRV